MSKLGMLLKSIFVVALGLLSCRGGEVESKEWKQLAIFNRSQVPLYVYNVKGIEIEKTKKSPFLKGIRYPQQFVTETTEKPLKIEFPIIIEYGSEIWSYEQIKSGKVAPRGRVFKFYKIEGWNGRNKIDSEGAIIFLCEDENNCRLIWKKGAKNIHKHDLKKRTKVPGI